ncbi:hypothetical protein PVK06_015111 [Gossypium arboreum]|uniref:Uncharacterized protein n=1 Tax=Gossypium arboreum TaxID=29729 RepID=A0ABR0PWK1_GOSAR|nr:hypothetical protein PVK06_015111 [Gossypium arboreum]
MDLPSQSSGEKSSLRQLLYPVRNLNQQVHGRYHEEDVREESLAETSYPKCVEINTASHLKKTAEVSFIKVTRFTNTISLVNPLRFMKKDLCPSARKSSKKSD